MLAAAFFTTSISLAILASNNTNAPSVLDEVVNDAQNAPVIPAVPSVPADQ